MSEVTWLVDNGQVKIAKDEIYEPHKVAVDNTSSFGHTYWNEMFTNYSGYVSRVGVSVYEFPVPAATKSVNLIFINTDIYTKDRGIHSGLTYVPPIKYLYVPKIGNRQLLISPSVLSAEHALQPIYQSDNGWSYRPSYKMWPGRPMVVNPRPVQVYESFFVISPLAANVDIRDVTIGPNSEFLIAIASAFTHSILKSTTGTTWTATTYSIPSELTVVTCFKKHPTGYIISGTLADNVNNLDANGVPIPIGDHVYESTDLINWTDMTQAVKTVGSLVTGAFSVLLTETNGLVYMKTTDYITYVSTYFVNYNYTWCVCTSLNTMVAELANLTTPDYLAADPISIGSVYVTLSIYGRVAISYDGITNWHVIDIIPLGDSTILMLSKIESEGRILALCSNGSILYSSNGYLWRNVTTNLSSCISFVNESVYLLVKLAYSYILTATSQIVLMSADLQTWTSASNFQDVSLRSCHTINSNTVMAGYSKTGIGYYNTL